MKAAITRVLGLLFAVGLSAGVWMAGYFTMRYPLGNPLLRLSYDCLHLFLSHRPDPRVLIIAINEDTDRKLGLHQGEAFSRRFHTRLLTRLKQAGVERVCYDILFDLPSPDPAADADFVNAVRSQGHVILGAAEEVPQYDSQVLQNTVIAPFPALRDAAEGWGLLNVAQPDPDGVIRGFNAGMGLVPAMAVRAAEAELREPPSLPDEDLWMRYPVLPGGIPTLEFADCLDPATVPDGTLRGKTVFVGGEYAADGYGRRDSFRTPYSRFGAPEIFGVAWHATAFLNARDGLWLVTSGQTRNGLWCLPFTMASLLIFRWKKGGALHAGVVITIWLFLTLFLSMAAIFLIWNDRVLVNWLVPVLVQFPCCLAVLLGNRLTYPKLKIVMAPAPKVIGEGMVFISFNSKEESLAMALKTFLDQNDFPAMICKEHIQEGSAWAETIVTAIEKCRALLFILSKNSLGSSWCYKEITRASNLGKPVLFLRTDDAPLTGGYALLLEATQGVDGRDKKPEVLFPLVITALRRVSEPESAGSPGF